MIAGGNNNLIGISGKIGSGKDTLGIVIKNCADSGYEIKKFADKLKDIVCLLIGCTRRQLEDREFKEKELGEEWKHTYYNIIDNQGGKLDTHLSKEDAENDLSFWDENINIAYPPSIEKIEQNLSPRKLLQLLGTECGRQIIHPNIWVNALFADFEDNKSDWLSEINSKWIITDVRFPNEAQAIKDRGGIVIRVNRDIIPTLEDCKQNLVEVKRTFLDGTVKTKEDFDSQPWLPYKYVKGDDPYLESALNGRNAENGICGIRLIASSHPSETALDDYNFDYVIENEGSIDELIQKIKQLKLV